MEIEMCIKCKKLPVHIKKRGLCRKCYSAERKKNGPFLKGVKGHSYTGASKKGHKINREFEFIKNYFNHNNWAYQPCLFRMGSEKYTPDFYDGERNVFIEVAGTRQAYSQNKEKYAMFNKTYPKIMLEIRSPTGELLSEMKNMWDHQRGIVRVMR